MESTSRIEAGDIEGALNAYFEALAPGFRTNFDKTLPEGWYERWLVDGARVIFPHDGPALQAWSFTAADASAITAPVLNVTTARTASFFTDVHETVQAWLPHAEHAVVLDSTHAMSPEML